MPSQTSDVVDKARALLEERRSELQGELTQIERAIADLGGRRGPGRPRGSGRGATRTGPRRRRRRRGGTRGEQALKHLKDSPGLTASEIATKLKIKPNYVYRVMAELEKDGKVRKEGRAYHPA